MPGHVGSLKRRHIIRNSSYCNCLRFRRPFLVAPGLSGYWNAARYAENTLTRLYDVHAQNGLSYGGYSFKCFPNA